MVEQTREFLKVSHWYPALSAYTFPTQFVKLTPGEIRALAEGEQQGENVQRAIDQLRPLMARVPGNAFVGVDTCSPTDTERFEGKRGAVFSPESAWRYLALSRKVRQAAADGLVECIFVRPFRRMSKPREFRLFIVDGKLKAMSQYHLIRHFRRLEGIKQFYWKEAKKLIKKLSLKLPADPFVMDLYFTSGDEILILDLNAWGECSPLMLHSWDRDWDEESGIVLMPPPMQISGDVNVSF